MNSKPQEILPEPAFRLPDRLIGITEILSVSSAQLDQQRDRGQRKQREMFGLVAFNQRQNLLIKNPFR